MALVHRYTPKAPPATPTHNKNTRCLVGLSPPLLVTFGSIRTPCEDTSSGVIRATYTTSTGACTSDRPMGCNKREEDRLAMEENMYRGILWFRHVRILFIYGAVTPVQCDWEHEAPMHTCTCRKYAIAQGLTTRELCMPRSSSPHFTPSIPVHTYRTRHPPLGNNLRHT